MVSFNIYLIISYILLKIFHTAIPLVDFNQFDKLFLYIVVLISILSLSEYLIKATKNKKVVMKSPLAKYRYKLKNYSTAKISAINQYCSKINGLSINIPGIYFVLALFMFVSAIHLKFSVFKPGGYIDEFYHIGSAVNLLTEGTLANVYGRGGYERSAYVSYLVAFSMKIFGQNMPAARIVPYTVGLINLLVVYLISNRFMSRWGVVTAIAFSSLTPIMIFVTGYVREYVFVQFFTVTTLLILLNVRTKIVYNISFSRRFRILVIPWLIGLFVFSQQTADTKFGVFLVAATFLILLSQEVLVVWDKNFIYYDNIKFIIVPIILTASFLIHKPLQDMFLGRIIFTGLSLDIGLYYSYLTHGYKFMTFLFILTYIYAFYKKEAEVFYICSIFAVGFIFHEFGTFSVEKEPAIRFILYLMPLFFIASAKGIDLIFSHINKPDFDAPTKTVIIFLLIISSGIVLSATYPDSKDYTPGAEIPRPDREDGVPNFKEYSPGFQYVTDRWSKGDILISTPAHPGLVYGPTPDYTIMTGKEGYSDQTTGKNMNGTEVYRLTGTPIIKTENEVNKILNDSKNNTVWIVDIARKQRDWGSDSLDNLVMEKGNIIKRSSEWENIRVYEF